MAPEKKSPLLGAEPGTTGLMRLRHRHNVSSFRHILDQSFQFILDPSFSVHPRPVLSVHPRFSFTFFSTFILKTCIYFFPQTWNKDKNQVYCQSLPSKMSKISYIKKKNLGALLLCLVSYANSPFRKMLLIVRYSQKKKKKIHSDKISVPCIKKPFIHFILLQNLKKMGTYLTENKGRAANFKTNIDSIVDMNFKKKFGKS